jgi:hypothetical protein
MPARIPRPIEIQPIKTDLELKDEDGFGNFTESNVGFNDGATGNILLSIFYRSNTSYSDKKIIIKFYQILCEKSQCYFDQDFYSVKFI